MHMKTKLKILYEDNHLIAVEKKAGILTQEATLNLPVLSTEVKKYIKEKYNKPGAVFLGLVHRLDVNVGGVICFAKTSKGASRVSKEIRERRFEKRYFVVVEGKIETEEEVTLKDFLIKDEKHKKAIITNKAKGKESILTFKKLAQINNLSLLEVNLITGRFHQIRAQLSNYGIPIYGDQKYGSVNESDIALYAYLIRFKHPVKDELLTITNLPNNDTFKPFLKLAGLI